MTTHHQIDLEVFKVVSRAIAESESLDIMTTHMAQMLVSSLDIRGCTIFVLNPDTDELEVLSSFGLSTGYLNKGPVMFAKSLGARSAKEPIVISDVNDSGQLQYPEAAQKEGIKAIVSLPVMFRSRTIGALRLYSGQDWVLSPRDLDSLLLLAEQVGLAMMCTRLSTALREIKDTADSIHVIWLGPDAG